MGGLAKYYQATVIAFSSVTKRKIQEEVFSCITRKNIEKKRNQKVGTISNISQMLYIQPC